MNKSLLILGCTGSVGFTLFKEFTLRGFEVVGVSRTPNKKTQEFCKTHTRTFHFNHDLSKEDEIANLKQRLEKFNITSIINCISIRKETNNPNKSVESISNLITANFNSQYLTFNILSTLLKPQDNPTFIFVSSIYGLRAPDFTIYNGCSFSTEPEYAFVKGGIIALSKYYAALCAKSNIRVNCVVLGGVLNNQPSKFLEAYGKHTISKGMVDKKELIGVFEFLISHASAAINGTEIIIDNGLTATI